MDEDLQIRLSAFQRLEELQRIYGDSIPNTALREGFVFAGEQVLFRAQQGIFKPRRMRLPLSIRTSADNPYGDELGSDGFLQYRYQGEDPEPSRQRLVACLHARGHTARVSPWVGWSELPTVLAGVHPR